MHDIIKYACVKYTSNLQCRLIDFNVTVQKISCCGFRFYIAARDLFAFAFNIHWPIILFLAFLSQFRFVSLIVHIVGFCSVSQARNPCFSFAKWINPFTFIEMTECLIYSYYVYYVISVMIFLFFCSSFYFLHLIFILFLLPLLSIYPY